MIFARKSDAALASLVKQLDRKVADHAGQQLAAFVNFLGSDADELEVSAKLLGAKNRIANVALVVPVDHENGPPYYNIHPDAELTAIIYRDQTVVANHAVAAGGLTKKKIAEIVADTDKILN